MRLPLKPPAKEPKAKSQSLTPTPNNIDRANLRGLT
jgi:hypothetical protein